MKLRIKYAAGNQHFHFYESGSIDSILRTTGIDYKKEKAIANEIVKKVNMHEDLIDAIKCVIEYHDKELQLLPVLKLSIEKLLAQNNK